MRAGWFPDPTGRYPLRWYDGSQWTPQAMDGWQRPVFDPIPPPPTTTGAAPPTATEAALPTATGAVTGTPERSVGPSTSPPPVAPPSTSPSPVGPPPAVVPADASGADSQWWRLIWRLAAIGSAAVLMALGLVFLPWLKIWDGTGWQALNYFEVVVAVDRYDGEFNDWQQAYHRGLAAATAMLALLGTSVAVLVAGRKPDPPSELTVLTAVLVIACGTGNFFGAPGLDIPSGVVTGSAPLVLGLGCLALLLAIPQERTKRREGP